MRRDVEDVGEGIRVEAAGAPGMERGPARGHALASMPALLGAMRVVRAQAQTAHDGVRIMIVGDDVALCVEADQGNGVSIHGHAVRLQASELSR